MQLRDPEGRPSGHTDIYQSPFQEVSTRIRSMPALWSVVLPLVALIRRASPASCHMRHECIRNLKLKILVNEFP